MTHHNVNLYALRPYTHNRNCMTEIGMDGVNKHDKEGNEKSSTIQRQPQNCSNGPFLKLTQY